jgi:hypothetical protein
LFFPPPTFQPSAPARPRDPERSVVVFVAQDPERA